ncbi:MAG: threonine--tRNA ligase [Thermoproteota archaeon]|nr:threonine--tRNA ligase [Thermoproteota archaeon]
MRILQLHSDFICYKPIQKEAALVEECEKKECRLEEVVVLFTSVEKDDNEGVAKRAVEEIKLFLKKLKVNRILIYPYSHLSSNLAKPVDALNVLKTMEKYAKELGIEAYRAPFGWCKKFSISIKGHPLAEQFRIILPGEAKKKEEEVSEALEAEEKAESLWFILDQSGRMVPVEKFDFSDYQNLEKFVKYEMAKSRAVEQMPPHITLMRKLEIADYEPASDSGNMRWYPKGRLIKSLIEQYVTRSVIEYGAMEVETPVMYDFQHPSLAKYLHRFPARQYIVKSEDKDYFLRFSACFGQFLMAHDAQISYRHLPMKIYELTKYSFRREKSGELVGLRRLRAFTMPDCHALCANLEQVKKEFPIRFQLCMDVLQDVCELTRDDYELAIRFTEDFGKENKDFIVSLANKFGKPVLIEMWKKRFFYFILKWDFNFVDNLDKASALSTDQIDIENGERYGITYVDADGKDKHPLILHCSPSGAIERCVYAMLEKAYREQKSGGVSILPLWLSPIQVRMIPLIDDFLEYAEKVADEIEKHSIRVDVDDRPLTMQKKVMEAEKEWVNYIIVVGEKEVTSNIVPVRDRKKRKIRKMKLQDFINEVVEKTKGKPFQPLTLPKHLSKRPKYFG